MIRTILNYSWQGGRKLDSGTGPLKMSRVLLGKQEWKGIMFRKDVRVLVNDR